MTRVQRLGAWLLASGLAVVALSVLGGWLRLIYELACQSRWGPLAACVIAPLTLLCLGVGLFLLIDTPSSEDPPP